MNTRNASIAGDVNRCSDPPITAQQAYWTGWNAAKSERALSDNSGEQRETVLGWLSRMGRTDLDILEVGCGNGWLCPSLKAFGRVTATDLSERAVEEAAARVPDVKFVGGDFMALDLGAKRFDVIVTLEVLSCVEDQAAFLAKLASLLRNFGILILATPNRTVLERHNRVRPASPDQLRHHVDREELVSLLTPHFKILDMRTVCPTANKGLYRFVLGRRPKKILRKLFGRSIERIMARAGMGWSLMALAQTLLDASALVQ